MTAARTAANGVSRHELPSEQASDAAQVDDGQVANGVVADTKLERLRSPRTSIDGAMDAAAAKSKGWRNAFSSKFGRRSRPGSADAALNGTYLDSPGAVGASAGPQTPETEASDADGSTASGNSPRKASISGEGSLLYDPLSYPCLRIAGRRTPS